MMILNRHESSSNIYDDENSENNCSYIRYTALQKGMK